MSKKISIILPVLNEEDGILRFHNELTKAINPLIRFTFEIIYINDGSTDKTQHLLSKIARKDKGIILVNLSRNFGHQNAISCGLDMCSGDAAITMDADFQHPLQLIPALIEQWEQGFDIVYTIRKNNRSISLLKRFTSKMFYKVINMLSKTKINENAADFVMISRKIIDLFRHNIRERERFLRGLINWVGFKSTSIEFEATKRLYGKSKYTLSRMARLGFSGIASFSDFPLKLGIIIGSVLMMSSILYGTYSIIIGLVSGESVPGWTTLMIFLMFFSSLQFLLIGLLGYYIGYIFDEVKQRPIYIIESVIKNNIID